MPFPEHLPGSQPESQAQATVEPLYRIILFDDDDHTYQYVVEMLITLFAKSEEDAFHVAYEVDHCGEAMVKVCPFDEAVEGRNAIHGYGPDPLLPHSKGSMKAAVMEAMD